MLYRVTFSGPNDSYVHYDVEAKDSDKAFQFAYAKLQAKDRIRTQLLKRLQRGQSQLASNLNPMTIMQKSLIQII